MITSFLRQTVNGLCRSVRRLLLKQALCLFLLFLLCVGIGSLLMLPLSPPFRWHGVASSWVLLPVLFVWWGIVTPMLGYWLLRQFLLFWHALKVHQWGTISSCVPVALHLSLAALEIGYQQSKDPQQRTHYQLLHLALRGYSLQVMMMETGMDEEGIAALVLSYNTWGPRVLRT